MMKMDERSYEIRDELTDKEIVSECIYLSGIKKPRMTEREMKLLYTLAKYGIL